MGEQTHIRAPQQARSIDKKEKLIEAAYELFCERGYYKTTTPEVARRAGLAVGSLYAYFKDKDDLFMAALDRYDARFDGMRAKLLADLSSQDRPIRDSLRSLLQKLIEIHRETKALNIEIRIVAYSDPAVRLRQEAQAEVVRSGILQSLRANAGRLRDLDLEAAAEVVDELIGGIVHRIAFGGTDVEGERILEATLDALCAYLLPS
jgi:AcrR family transcriptional regulator